VEQPLQDSSALSTDEALFWACAPVFKQEVGIVCVNPGRPPMPPGIPFRTSQFKNRKDREVTTTILILVYILYMFISCKHEHHPRDACPDVAFEL
jgi:hypothetical protein